MTQPKPQTREERIQALAATVRSIGDGYYTVDSESGDGWKYLCLPSKTAPLCDCQDHRRRRLANPLYLCKHLEAVRAYLMAQPRKAPSTSQSLHSMKQHLAKVAQRQAASLARLEEIPPGLSMIEA